MRRAARPPTVSAARARLSGVAAAHPLRVLRAIVANARGAVTTVAATMGDMLARTPDRPPRRRREGGETSAAHGESGQALLLLVALIAVVLVAAVVLGAIARGLGGRGDNQRAADLGALGGARTMRASYARLFAPPLLAGRPNPAHLDRGTYLARARARAEATARLNGAEAIEVSFPDGDSFAPVRIRVTVRDRAVVEVGGRRRSAAIDATAEAELSAAASSAALGAGPGDYAGPLAVRQGRPMRPDVAAAFDRMAAAAAADGVQLIVNSGFRSTAEQARLFAANPDPRWVAPPGRSLHRLGTELDLGPPSAYGWLSAHAARFHFVQRYSWEPWHYELSSPCSQVAPWGQCGIRRSAASLRAVCRPLHRRPAQPFSAPRPVEAAEPLGCP